MADQERQDPTSGPFEVQDHDGEWALIGSPGDRGDYIMKVAEWDVDDELTDEGSRQRPREENGANVRLAVASRNLYEEVCDIVRANAANPEHLHRLARLVHFVQTGQGTVD